MIMLYMCHNQLFELKNAQIRIVHIWQNVYQLFIVYLCYAKFTLIHSEPKWIS